jgi:hypothetical protein
MRVRYSAYRVRTLVPGYLISRTQGSKTTFAREPPPTQNRRQGVDLRVQPGAAARD